MNKLIMGLPVAAFAFCAIVSTPAQAEVTMTPMDDRGRVVIVKPWEGMSEDEKIDQLRSLSTQARRIPCLLWDLSARFCLARSRPILTG